ncbi:MAG: ATP-grasp fold amidoligase family protein [Bacilli bacterium]|nr:ATP-grasp fold amidoligase family protein [Bacilli bacterium]
MLNKNLHENKIKRFFAQSVRGIIKLFSPTLYVKCQYRYITHHKLNLKNPIRYTEKLQYLRLKVYPKNDLVSKCASRDGARDYLKEINEEDKLIPTYGIYDRFDDIDFSILPNQFVMKCTHASGFNYLVKNKDELDIKKLRKMFNKFLKTDYGKKTVEPHYSKIKPRIIIEKAITDLSSLPDEYKIHVFNGKAKYLYLVTGRGKDIKYNNYYIDWTPFNEAQFNGWDTSEKQLKKPDQFDEMVKFAEKIASPFPFVRVDLYLINNKIYFSEMTFTPAKGTLIFDDDKADFEIGNWLDINAK